MQSQAQCRRGWGRNSLRLVKPFEDKGWNRQVRHIDGLSNLRHTYVLQGMELSQGHPNYAYIQPQNPQAHQTQGSRQARDHMQVSGRHSLYPYNTDWEGSPRRPGQWVYSSWAAGKAYGAQFFISKDSQRAESGAAGMSRNSQSAQHAGGRCSA